MHSVERNPQLREHFKKRAEKRNSWVASVLSHTYDLSDNLLIADIGGEGTFLAELLRIKPHLSGILFDLPNVLSSAPSILAASGVSHRCTILADDFLASVPEGADIYCLKHVLHDWNDKHSMRILRNCRRMMRKGLSKLLLLESLMPSEAATAGNLAYADIHMLAVTNGYERTLEEFRRLLFNAGCDLTRSIPLGGTTALIEAVSSGF